MAFQTLTLLHEVNRSVARSKMTEVTTDVIEEWQRPSSGDWMTGWHLSVAGDIWESISTTQFSVQKANVHVQRRIYTIQYVHIPHAWFQTRTASVAKDNRNRSQQCRSEWTRDYIEAPRRAESALVLHNCYRYNILVPVPTKWRKLQNRTQRNGAGIFILSILVSALLL